MAESIHTLIVGGGQAGLATSYFLKQHGVEHAVLEQAAHPADAWRSQRWDSFTLVTPNLSFKLPGAEYDGPDPEGYMTRGEIIRRFDDYTARNALPVICGTQVLGVTSANGSGYRLRTAAGEYLARNVVMANGWFRQGKIPAYAGKVPPAVRMMHSCEYRSPEALPPGAVLVVGAAQTGTQIAEELYLAGRRVFLATGGAPRAPRRYRGKDVFVWLAEAGFFDRTIDQFTHLPGRIFVAPQITGRRGGYTLNLHRFYRDGVRLLGHALGFEDGRMIFAPDLQANLAKADQGERFIMKLVDDYIAAAGLDVPEEQVPRLTDAHSAPDFTSLDLEAEGISTIIWACGFRYDSSLLAMPVLDAYGYPVTQGGVSQYPGLYFIGIPFLSKLKSGFLFGVGEDAERVASHIAARQ